ncbi:hypothetical protein [Persicobacter sp. CCB-QB2]|uniref:hypothetical protein n=1 Tax=Persicobacter sp. CCB-QB2 TaxID=1561025 RepID=UPI0006A95750|nr:hypothetical protein [Persicobacter sp. CCB-QB2]
MPDFVDANGFVNPVPDDKRRYVASLASIANSPVYYVGYTGVYAIDEGKWYNVSGGDAMNGWIFEAAGRGAGSFSELEGVARDNADLQAELEAHDIGIDTAQQAADDAQADADTANQKADALADVTQNLNLTGDLVIDLSLGNIININATAAGNITFSNLGNKEYKLFITTTGVFDVTIEGFAPYLNTRNGTDYVMCRNFGGTLAFLDWAYEITQGS